MALPAHSRRFVLRPAGGPARLAAGAAEASAATKIKRANAVDTDGDGSVDGFDVTFSAKLRGKARSGGSLPFTVSGYRVTGGRPSPAAGACACAWPRAPACDLGARPEDLLPGRPAHRRAQAQAAPLADRPRPQGPQRAPDHLRGHRRRATATGTSTPSCSPTRARFAARPAPAPARSAWTATRSPPSGAARGRYADAAAEGEGVVRHRRGARDLLPQAAEGVAGRARHRQAPRRGRQHHLQRHARQGAARASSPPAPTTPTSTASSTAWSARFSEAVKADPAAIAVAGARVISVARRGRDGFAAALAEGPLRSRRAAAGRVRHREQGRARPRRQRRSARASVVGRGRRRPGDRWPRARSTAAASPGRLDTLALTYSEPVSHAADSDGSYPVRRDRLRAQLRRRLRRHLARPRASPRAPLPDSGTRPAGRLHARRRRPGARRRRQRGGLAGLRRRERRRSPRGCSARRTLDTDADGKLDRVRYEFTEPISSAQRACSAGCGFTAAGLVRRSPRSPAAGTASR